MKLHPPLHLGVVAIEKGAFESPLTKIANFTYLYTLVQWSKLHNNKKQPWRRSLSDIFTKIIWKYLEIL